MRTAPRHWWTPPGAPSWPARLLAPAAWVWGIGARLRAARRGTVAPIPVICVGNLVAGGGGKTPMVAALLRRYAHLSPHVVTRGHGGRQRHVHRVDPDRDTADRVGDEPLLHAALAPTWVAADRAAGVRAAAAAGAGLAILDDGFQAPDPRRDLSILMVDAGQGFGNGRLIPAGPLREPVGPGLARADLVVLVGGAAARAQVLALWPQLAGAVAAEVRPLPTGLDLAGQAVVAFAGIARPGKFFATLREMGARLVAAEGFADHAPYGAPVLRRLAARARAAGALLVTTEKDAARLTPAWRAQVLVVPVELVPADWAPFDAAVARLGRPGESGRGGGMIAGDGTDAPARTGDP